MTNLLPLAAGVIALLAPPSEQTQSGAEPPRLRSGSITDADYPAAAVAGQQEGTTRVRLSIGSGGNVTGCEVTETSGTALLDDTTCALIKTRFTFYPARNQSGEAVPSYYRTSVTWQTQEASGMSFESFSLVISADLDAGRVTACRQETPDAEPRELTPSFCSTALDRSLLWAATKPDVTRIVEHVAFTAQDDRRPSVRPEWGAVLVRADGDLLIGADGGVAGCTNVQKQAAPDADQLALPDPCSVSARNGRPLFGPAAGQELRSGHMTIATFAVRPAPRAP